MIGADKQITLHDGRRLGYAEYGDPDGEPLIYFHGFPSSRLEAGLCQEGARRRQVRVIAIDRPGYGLSDFKPERQISDWPDDVVELAGLLGLERFALLGVSGGGPYALACAWKIPQRLTVVGIVCGLGPVYDHHVLDTMRWHARLAFTLARRSRWLLSLAYGGVLANVVLACPEIAYRWLTITASPTDRGVLRRPEVKMRLLASLLESLRQGAEGVLRDAVLYAQDWGFAIEDIEMNIDLWHGENDRIVPRYHADMFASTLARGRLRILPNEGHFSLPIQHCDAILEGLFSRD
jgi:pimeloyl-ACP methyl ester carboxylesterase